MFLVELCHPARVVTNEVLCWWADWIQRAVPWWVGLDSVSV